MITGLELFLTNEHGLPWATTKAKQTRLLFYTFQTDNHFIVTVSITLHTCDQNTWQNILKGGIPSVSEVSIYQSREGVVERTEQVQMRKSQGDMQTSKKRHQRPIFSNQPPPLTFHLLPVMPPHYESIKALIHPLILEIRHWKLPHRHSQRCAFLVSLAVLNPVNLTTNISHYLLWWCPGLLSL